MNISHVLIVEQGTPFEEGAFIPLSGVKTVLGRQGNQWDPDIAFNNVFVSRKHLIIHRKNGQFFIEDLNSKHGTFLNNQRLKANEQVPLRVTDKITLANELIQLSFSANLDVTFDMLPVNKSVAGHVATDCYLDPLKQEAVIQEVPYQFSGKEYMCFEYLLQNRDGFVSKEALKKKVWPERCGNAEETPDVSNEEINVLLYRIRRKTQRQICIENIRGKGYILSFHEEAGRGH